MDVPIPSINSERTPPPPPPQLKVAISSFWLLLSYTHHTFLLTGRLSSFVASSFSDADVPGVVPHVPGIAPVPGWCRRCRGCSMKVDARVRPTL